MASNRRDFDFDFDDAESKDENQPREFLPRRFVGEGGTRGSRNHSRFLDRSKVRILLCDGDEKSSREVSELLCNCSYQVTSVRTARQVIDALHENGSQIDIILSEIDLPSSKMFKMLKYIMGMEELRHIPIVMMSAKDEVSLVVKCLRFGVADYLVKPLRRNEMLNLWIHMWRRRRMLDLPEKDMWTADADMLFSDPSDGNTNSALLSDDTDNGSRTVAHKIRETDAKAKDSCSVVESDKMLRNELYAQEDECTSGRIFSCSHKNELKVGKSSAFLTYVKSNQRMKTSSHVPSPELSKSIEMAHSLASQPHKISFPSADMNCSTDIAVPCLLPQMLAQNIGNSPCPSVYHQMPIMPSFPYYHPVAPPHLWSSMPGSSSLEQKNGRFERREAALLKFRKKRKDRCFDKKIRYVNRKRLAERRPRVKGQFVRQSNGVCNDLNGEDEDDDDDDDDEEDDDDDDVAEEESSRRNGSDPHL